MTRRRNEQSIEQSSESQTLPMDPAIWSEVVAILGFSPQQARIVELVLSATSDKQIAQRLCLSVDTVRTYLKRIYARFRVSGRVELVVRVFVTALEITERNACHRQR